MSHATPLSSPPSPPLDVSPPSCFLDKTDRHFLLLKEKVALYSTCWICWYCFSSVAEFSSQDHTRILKLMQKFSSEENRALFASSEKIQDYSLHALPSKDFCKAFQHEFSLDPKAKFWFPILFPILFWGIRLLHKVFLFPLLDDLKKTISSADAEKRSQFVNCLLQHLSLSLQNFQDLLLFSQQQAQEQFVTLQVKNPSLNWNDFFSSFVSQKLQEGSLSPDLVQQENERADCAAFLSEYLLTSPPGQESTKESLIENYKRTRNLRNLSSTQTTFLQQSLPLLQEALNQAKSSNQKAAFLRYYFRQKLHPIQVRQPSLIAYFAHFFSEHLFSVYYDTHRPIASFAQKIEAAYKNPPTDEHPFLQTLRKISLQPFLQGVTFLTQKTADVLDPLVENLVKKHIVRPIMEVSLQTLFTSFQNNKREIATSLRPVLLDVCQEIFPKAPQPLKNFLQAALELQKESPVIVPPNPEGQNLNLTIQTILELFSSVLRTSRPALTLYKQQAVVQSFTDETATVRSAVAKNAAELHQTILEKTQDDALFQKGLDLALEKANEGLIPKDPPKPVNAPTLFKEGVLPMVGRIMDTIKFSTSPALAGLSETQTYLNSAVDLLNHPQLYDIAVTTLMRTILTYNDHHLR